MHARRNDKKKFVMPVKIIIRSIGLLPESTISNGVIPTNISKSLIRAPGSMGGGGNMNQSFKIGLLLSL